MPPEERHLHQVINLRKVEPSSYFVRLRLRELWRAWRHGISLPHARVRPEIPIAVGGGKAWSEQGNWYAGQWTVPKGVTSVDIEVVSGGGDEIESPGYPEGI